MNRLKAFCNAKVMPFVEFPGFEGSQYFGAILDGVKKGVIKNILNFGELFPFYYPQIADVIKKTSVYATAPLNWPGNTVIPVALNLEKKGRVNTLFGIRELQGTIEPPSGARDIMSILGDLGVDHPQGKTFSEPKLTIDIADRLQSVVKMKTVKKKKALVMFGEKTAYTFLGLFDKGMVKINPQDAMTLGIKYNDIVTLKTKQGNVDLRAAVTADVGQGNIIVPVEQPDTRALFAYEIVEHFISFIPTEVEIWRKG
jgi:hypothetical protein